MNGYNIFYFACGIIGHEQKNCVNLKILNLNTPKYKRYNAKIGVAQTRSLDDLIDDITGEDSEASRETTPTVNLAVNL